MSDRFESHEFAGQIPPLRLDIIDDIREERASEVLRPPIVQTAVDVVAERTEQYGQPADSLNRVSGAINALYGTDFKPHDVAVILALLKLSRIVESPTKLDNWVDLIGYAMIAATAAEEEGTELR